MKSVYRHEWTAIVWLACLDFNTATLNGTLCAKEHACCSCTISAHGVFDKDTTMTTQYVCGRERSVPSGRTSTELASPKNAKLTKH